MPELAWVDCRANGVLFVVKLGCPYVIVEDIVRR